MKISLTSVQTFFARFSLRQLTLAWYRYFKLLFTLLFLGVLVLGGYLWYTSLHNYRWDEGQKKAYMEKTFTETNLKEKEFSRLLDTLKTRAEQQKNPLTISRNLFTGEPAVNQQQ
jgi:hypothetical protein